MLVINSKYGRIFYDQIISIQLSGAIDAGCSFNKFKLNSNARIHHCRLKLNPTIEIRIAGLSSSNLYFGIQYSSSRFISIGELIIKNLGLRI